MRKGLKIACSFDVVRGTNFLAQNLVWHHGLKTFDIVLHSVTHPVLIDMFVRAKVESEQTVCILKIPIKVIFRLERICKLLISSLPSLLS